MSNRWVYALLSGCAVFALGCAAQSMNREAASEAVDSHVRFNVQTLPSGVQLEIEGESPLVYTAFRLRDPLRLIIDLAGVSFSPNQEAVAVNHGAVTTVSPATGSMDANVARVEIGLTQEVDYQLRPDGTRLLVAISAPDATAGIEMAAATPLETVESPAPVPSTTEAALVPEPASGSPVATDVDEPAPALAESPAPSTPAPMPSDDEPQQDATKVTAIQVKPGTTLPQVVIQGNGRFHPKAMTLDGPRLVIDLPGTTSKVARSRIAVNGPLLKQIRIGEHVKPPKVRVVFDLAAMANYQLDQQGGSLTVTLLPMSSPPNPTAAPAVKPAGKEAAHATAVPPPPLPKRHKAVSAQLETARSNDAQAGVVGGTQKKFTGRLISLDFQDADLDDVLRLMADVSGLNIVVSESVKGKVTVKLLNVPWDQALDLILRTHGLGQVREGNILRIDTLDNLSKQQDEEARAKESATRAEDLVTRVMYVNYAEAGKLVETLKKNLSPRGDITIDSRTNALIVKDIEKKTQEVAALVKVLDLQTPQVLIEARIVSADSNFARDLGVQWGGDFSTTTGPYQFGAITGPTGDVGSPATGFLVNLPASGGAGSLGNLGFTFGRLTSNPFSLDLRLSAGEKQGLSKTISSPKIAVLDNQEAKIQQGTSIPYTSTTNNQVSTIFVDATLVLEVTPHVTPDGSILMKLRIANDEPGAATPQGLPSINKKEAKTNIMVKDGETAVLGGVFKSTKTESVGGIPFFRRIPLLGWLFKQESKSDTTNELLVFLTPKII